jgi:peptidoglycan/xylan/chitin deacetylase (PgdA/CDA1 family)
MDILDRLLKLSIAITFYVFHDVFYRVISILKKKLPASLVIVTYHLITEGQRNKFAKQMDMLLQIGNPVRLDQPIPQNINKKYIGVTFDDGYRSAIQNALPALRERRIPATIFVPTGALERKPPWIKNVNHVFANETVLSPEDLKSLPKDLVTVGSHTVTHCRLSNIDEDTCRKEIGDSKSQLELILCNSVGLISLPYGSFDQNYTHLFKDVGYERIFLNVPTYPTTKTDLYVMGRISVNPDDWPLEYGLKLRGAYQWLPCAIKLKKDLIAKCKLASRLLDPVSAKQQR